MAIIPTDPSTAFWMWSKKLGELIFWAREAEPATATMTTRDGWLDAFKRDVQKISDMSRDAAPDDVTRNQVIRSRSLALQLVRMLHEWPDVNSTPCRNWSQVDQQVVNDLAELQSQFAKLGDGNRPPGPDRTAPIEPSPTQSKATRSNLDWLKLVPPPAAETWHRQELVGHTVAEIMQWCDTTKRLTLRSRNGKSLWLMRTADNKIACYFRSETEYAKANLRKLPPPKKSKETQTNQ